MFAIIGIVLVIGAVGGGYAMSHGKFPVLWQPAELVVIFGTAIGSMLVANPIANILALVKGILGVLKGSPYTKNHYLDTLKALMEVFSYGRKNGLQKLETDIENPKQSQLFSQHKVFTSNHHALDFVCDTIRTSIAGGIGHFEIEQSMEADIDIMKHELEQPVAALKEMADSLPGMGIVASSPWVASAVLQKKSANTLPPLSLAPSSAFSSATASLALWPATFKRPTMAKSSTCMSCAPASGPSSKVQLPSSPSKWRDAPFPRMSAPASRTWSKRSRAEANSPCPPRTKNNRFT